MCVEEVGTLHFLYFRKRYTIAIYIYIDQFTEILLLCTLLTHSLIYNTKLKY